MSKETETAIVSAERIALQIVLLRGHKILLSRDLALLYGVSVKALIQAVQRNRERFPDDFMFRLTWEEVETLKSQNITSEGESGEQVRRSRSQTVTLKRGQNVKYLPYAFTEQGVAMLSSVLRSPGAVQVNIAIMRAFVKLREVISTNRELAHKFAELEKRVGSHDEQIQGILEAIRQLLAPPASKPGREIGFHVRDEVASGEAPGCQSSARSPWGAIFTSFGSNWPSTSTRSRCAAMTEWMSL